MMRSGFGFPPSDQTKSVHYSGFTSPHSFYGYPLKLSRVSLPFHFAAPLPAKCAHLACLNSRVHSILGDFVSSLQPLDCLQGSSSILRCVAMAPTAK